MCPPLTGFPRRISALQPTADESTRHTHDGGDHSRAEARAQQIHAAGDVRGDRARGSVHEGRGLALGTVQRFRHPYRSALREGQPGQGLFDGTTVGDQCGEVRALHWVEARRVGRTKGFDSPVIGLLPGPVGHLGADHHTQVADRMFDGCRIAQGLGEGALHDVLGRDNRLRHAASKERLASGRRQTDPVLLVQSAQVFGGHRLPLSHCLPLGSGAHPTSRSDLPAGPG